jgi:hypothetical protein
LPVVDQIAVDYLDEVRFVAVAGHGTLEATTERAGQWFENLDWGLDDAIWDLYGVPYQPVTFVMTGDDRVLATWAGAASEDEIRSRLDEVVALGQ